MDPLHHIAEQRLKEAIDAGQFDDYPGKGEPLELEDLSHLDPEMRGAYILLKGHGYISEESDLRAQIVSVHTLLAACRNAEEREVLTERERRLRLRFSILLEQRGVPAEVIDRLSRALAERG